MQAEAKKSEIGPELIERFQLKAFVEACLVLEEGVAGIRDIDMGLMMGAGMLPGPFARADLRGLDEVLAALEKAQANWGEHFAPPVILRRLVAQGRLGVKSGQGFYPYPQPEPGYETAKVKLDKRGPVAIFWLDNPPANALSTEVLQGLLKAWNEIEGDGETRSMILASPNPTLFCAGADIKGFTSGDSSSIAEAHGVLRRWEKSSIVTIAAVNGLAFGGGCEVSMSCDVRLASYSATFAQPEVNLGIIPGWGGTQRLPRLVGYAKAFEMNTIGDAVSAEDAYQHGLVNRVVPDHELFDTAMAWAKKFATKPPLAIEAIKEAIDKSELDEGLKAEGQAFAKVFQSEDAKEGVSAFLGKRTPKFKGK